MKKLKKLLLVCLSLTFLFAISNAGEINPSYTKKELLHELIKLNDKNIPGTLTRQWTAKENKYFGAVFYGDSDVSPNGTVHFIQTLMCSYVSPGSEFYKSDELLRRMTLPGSGLLNLQHEDGTIDLLSTNFHSTPDLGFTIYPVALAYSIMLQNNGKAIIKVLVDGPENLPVALELVFRSGGKITNVSPRQGIENAFLAKNEEYATYTKGSDTIKNRAGRGYT